jgi:4-hydroxythreonine-4-phosphate dehydrogenase
MAPAFPANGRTTARGRQRLNGAPLEESEIWRREGIAGDADVPRMLEAAGLRSTLIGLDGIRSGADRLKSVMRDRATVNDVVVCDAETDEDLRFIAAAAISLGRAAVWAGSAGLARHLPEAAGLSRKSLPVFEPAILQGPILFVVGSPSSVSRAQVEMVASEPGVVVAASRESAVLAEAFASGSDVVMLMSETQDARLLAPYSSRIGGLVLTGGETARAVLQALGIRALWPVSEVEPGVPLSIALAPRPIPIITKAGAFGDRNTFSRCRAGLRSS